MKCWKIDMSEILHSAKVVSVSPQLIELEIETRSACASCHLQQACLIGDSKTKKIQIKNQTSIPLAPGDWVLLSMSMREGEIALFITYALPLFLVLGTLFMCLKLGMTEIMSGICSIIVLIPYYFGVFLKHKSLDRCFNLKIVKKINPSKI